MNIVVLTVLFLLGVTLFYRGRGFWAWVTPGALALVWWGAGGVGSPAVFRVIAGAFGALVLVFGVRPLRRALVSPCIKARWVTVSVLVFMLVLSGYGFGFVKQSFFPDSTRPQFMVHYWLQSVGAE